jgi:hypothetical protein
LPEVGVSHSRVAGRYRSSRKPRTHPYLDISCHLSHQQQPSQDPGPPDPDRGLAGLYINPRPPTTVFFNSYSIILRGINRKELISPNRQTGSITPPTSTYPLCWNLTTAAVTAHPLREREETPFKEEIRKGIHDCDGEEEPLVQACTVESKEYPSVRHESRARLEQRWEELEPSQQRAGA